MPPVPVHEIPFSNNIGVVVRVRFCTAFSLVSDSRLSTNRKQFCLLSCRTLRRRKKQIHMRRTSRPAKCQAGKFQRIQKMPETPDCRIISGSHVLVVRPYIMCLMLIFGSLFRVQIGITPTSDKRSLSRITSWENEFVVVHHRLWPTGEIWLDVGHVLVLSIGQERKAIIFCHQLSTCRTIHTLDIRIG
jgi:hypothetical protein